MNAAGLADSNTPSPPANPGLPGPVYCLLAALLYATVNTGLRSLVGQLYPPWIICIKESVTVATLAPWVLYRTVRGPRIWPSWRALWPLLLVALTVQLLGNLSVLWAFQVIGLSVTVPIYAAVNLAGSALLGWLVLREPVTRRTMAAIGLLILAIILLQRGATSGEPQAERLGQAALAVTGACLAGVTYAALAVMIRRSVRGAIHPAVVMFVTTGMGVVSLGPLSLWHLGLPALLETPPHLLATMLLTGALNCVAFLAAVKGYQLTPVARANVLSSTQVAMVAMVGLLFFHEPPRLEILAGVLLTMAATAFTGPRFRRHRRPNAL